MSWIKDLQSIPNEPRQWRSFSRIIGVLLLAIGGWLWWRSNTIVPAWFIAGAAVMLIGQFIPALLRWPYLLWMAIGVTLGMIVSTIILTLFYFVALTPFGLLAKLLRKDFLQKKLEPKSKSYWIPRDPQKPSRYEKQF